MSWYQSQPETSLNLFRKLNVPFTAKIIDIGGGDSLLVDHLLEMGYLDITVLDISETAIERAKIRLGSRADKVNWIVADVTSFHPTQKYDVWHDRAAFHFLTKEDEISEYIRMVENSISQAGFLFVGTFSEQGPTKCSGIEIKQYSASGLSRKLEHSFKKLKCFTKNHKTPSGSVQSFIYCSFKKL